MKNIKRFQNEQDLSVSVGNSYSEYKLMQILLDNFHQGGKYTGHTAIHQEQLIREEKFSEKQYLYIKSLQTDYLNLDSSSGSGRNNERANIVQTKCTFCGGANNFAENFFK